MEMKKLTYFIVVMLAVIIAGCGQNHNKPTGNNTDTPETTAAELTPAVQFDLFYIEGGQLYFYDLQSNEATHYANETDSIVRAALSKKNVLYYSVAKDGDLLLRSLDLNAVNPMPEQLADWEVSVEGWTEMDGFAQMYLNYEETQVALERDIRWFAGLVYNLAVYDIDSKTVTVHKLYEEVMEDDEFVDFRDLPDNSGFNRWGPSDASYTMDERLENVASDIYYVGGGLRTCLTDQISMDDFSNIGIGKEDFHVEASLDPTGKKALIGYDIVLGDGVIGYYYVSSIDGKQQVELQGSDYDTSEPTWLPDGSLIYLGYDDGSGLYLLNNDGVIRKIADAEIYDVLH